MIDSILGLDFLQTIDPLWLSLAPLIAFNILIGSTIIFFKLTYKHRVQEDGVDLKEHSVLLSRFWKEWCYWVIRPITRLAVKHKISPNAFTFTGFLLAALAGYFFYKGMIGLAGWTMIFGAICDMFDGRVARLSGMSSASGAFFDSVMDRFSEGVIFFGLAGFYHDSWLLFVVLCGLVGSLMVSYVKARGEGVGVDCKGGIMQRPERIVYLSVSSILSPVLAALVAPLVALPFDFLTIAALILIAVMTNSTAIYRMFYIIRKLPPAKHPSFQFLAWWDNLFLKK